MRMESVPSMRNRPDTAGVAQSLDGERLMGCLHYPGKMIFPGALAHKVQNAQDQSLIEHVFIRTEFFARRNAREVGVGLRSDSLVCGTKQLR
jgi:hypothetical protein